MGLGAGGVAVLVPAASPAAATTRPAPAAVDIAARGSLGKVLVDAAGRTLYHFTSDRVHSLACTGGCLAIWPPLLLAKGQKAPRAGAGVAHLGTVARPHGERQVTYEGEPLYVYSGDKKSGQTRGEGIGGVWFVVKVAAHAASTTSSSGGYY
ncbi:MAG TPA: hypothetical protein VND23_00920 [Acidimicrobiales bacterium]|nr:hypothetical protein [Acidimicrobiales bacterium]